MRNRGFTLLECLFTISVLSLLTSILAFKYKVNSQEDKIFISNYLYLQSDSILNKTRNEMINEYSSHRIYFDENGKVNMAQTVIINNAKITIFLGTGCLRYEK